MWGFSTFQSIWIIRLIFYLWRLEGPLTEDLSTQESHHGHCGALHWCNPCQNSPWVRFWTGPHWVGPWALVDCIWETAQKHIQNPEIPKKHRVHTNFFDKFARTFPCFPVTRVRNPAEIVQINSFRWTFLFWVDFFRVDFSACDIWETAKTSMFSPPPRFPLPFVALWAPKWESAKASHKSMFALLTPEICS